MLSTPSSLPNPTSSAQPQVRPRLAALDGLRLIAALMVVGFHYVSGGPHYWSGSRTGEPVFPILHLVTAYGWMGVNLFFVISGFVICMTCWDRGLGQFFVSRVTRLYPAFWVGVVFTTAIVTLIPADYPRRSTQDIVANLTMFPGALGADSVDGVYWTLWNEALFYLLFAIVVWRGVNYHRTVLFCLLWTAASILAAAVDVPAVSTIVDQEYSMYFIAGIAMYLMHRFKPTLLLWGIIGFSLLLALNGFGERLTAINQMTGEQQRWWIGALLIAGCFLAVLAVARGWLNRLTWRGFTVAGAMTYPLYLLHGVAGCAIINWASPKVGTTPAARYTLLASVVAGMLLLSWLCHRFIERPVSRAMRSRLNSAVRSMRAASPGSSAPQAPATTAVPASAAPAAPAPATV